MPIHTKEPDILTDENDRLRNHENERLHQIELNQPAIALLRSWREVDEESAEDQRQTLAALVEALNESRPPGYELFP